ncbi:MAG: flagellar basal-body rod protein FlgF [Rhizobiaceae bacterium]
MQEGLYVALSSQIALERRLSTIADNVANTNTVGFRATGIRFEEVLSSLRSDAPTFVSSGQSYLHTQSGALKSTGNKLDFAIQGDVWFAIETDAGPTLTRDGRFKMLETGELVTLSGNPVLDPGGSAINLNPAGGAPLAGRDGFLSQNGNQVAAIGLFEFQPGPDARRHADSGILANGPLQPVVDRPDVGVLQGFVEQSNVNPLKELTKLIMVQRTFDNVTSLVRDSENAYEETIKAFGS